MGTEDLVPKTVEVGVVERRIDLFKVAERLTALEWSVRIDGPKLQAVRVPYHFDDDVGPQPGAPYLLIVNESNVTIGRTNDRIFYVEPWYTCSLEDVFRGRFARIVMKQDFRRARMDPLLVDEVHQTLIMGAL